MNYFSNLIKKNVIEETNGNFLCKQMTRLRQCCCLELSEKHQTHSEFQRLGQKDMLTNSGFRIFSDAYFLYYIFTVHIFKPYSCLTKIFINNLLIQF